ncbi:MAG: V-type ATPase subunit [Candidatus Odinarchaeota archaeon]
MGFLKQLIMDEDTLNKLADFSTVEDFLSFIAPFYPNLKISKNTIEEIEKSLYDVFFRLIGKLIFISPLNIRRFLKDYLSKYEIMNIKQIILGSIIGMDIEEKSKNVNFLIEKYLENTDFIKKLIEISSLDRIQLFMKTTKYNKAIREGILYFKKYNEIFVLEAFLDRLYYINLMERERRFNEKEREMISFYDLFMTEIYNINLIYRGILNKIDPQLLNQFIVRNYLFLDERKIDILLNQGTLQDFFSKVDEFLGRIIQLDYHISLSTFEHPIWELDGLYTKYYFKKFKIKIDDIEYLTIYRIIELIIKKEKEVKLYIIPNLVKIINNKFSRLEKMD